MKKSTNPEMHSAEHILNATMVNMFDCGRCVSAHIERKKSKCDYPFIRPLTADEIREIEIRVNAVIMDDLPVMEEYISMEQARTRFDMRRLPEDAGETVRVVRIGDYDACLCIGPHVASTGEIGKFRITTTSYENNILRIRYKLDRSKHTV